MEEVYIPEGLSTLSEGDLIISRDAIRYEVRRLMKEGIYHQDELFDILYPIYQGHYSVLREIIAEEKNYA